MMLEEKIKLLHPDLTGDCESSLLKEIKELNEIWDRITDLSQEKSELQTQFEKRVKVLRSMVGSVFEFIRDETPIPTVGKKSYVLLKNVNFYKCTLFPI